MKMAIVALGLLTCGQASPRSYCATPCGLRVLTTGHEPRMYCEDLKLAERVLVSKLADKLPNACRMFNGVMAWEHPGNSSILRGQEVSGWSECHLSRFHFHVGYEPWRRPWHTAFMHELVHIAQGCYSYDENGKYSDHGDWQAKGLYKALDEAQAELDRLVTP